MEGKVLKTTISGNLNKLGECKITLIDNELYFISVFGEGTVVNTSVDMYEIDSNEHLGKSYTIPASEFKNIKIQGNCTVIFKGYNLEGFTLISNESYPGSNIDIDFNNLEYRPINKLGFHTDAKTSIDSLRHNSSLTSLSLGRCENIYGNINALNNCKDLTNLAINNTNIEGDLNKFLEHMWTIKGKVDGTMTIDIGDCKVLFNNSNVLGKKTVTFTPTSISYNGSTFNGTSWS